VNSRPTSSRVYDPVYLVRCSTSYLHCFPPRSSVRSDSPDPLLVLSFLFSLFFIPQFATVRFGPMVKTITFTCPCRSLASRYDCTIGEPISAHVCGNFFNGQLCLRCVSNIILDYAKIAKQLQSLTRSLGSTFGPRTLDATSNMDATCTFRNVI